MFLRPESEYMEFHNDRELFTKADTVPGIPLFTMELLREADFPISRGLSYERTVDEFALELEGNIKLSRLKKCPSMAVLLDRAGVLIKENGQWTLIFRKHLPADVVC